MVAVQPFSTRFALIRLGVVLVLAAALGGCAQGGGRLPVRQSDGSVDGTAPGEDASPEDAGAEPEDDAGTAPEDDAGTPDAGRRDGGAPDAGPSCRVPSDCDDGLECTVDRCLGDGRCTHDGTDWDGDGFVAESCGDGRDCDDFEEDVAPGEEDVCDGLDNDCSGEADDSFTCAAGSTRPCTLPDDVEGMQVCRNDCSGYGPCTGEEVCNGEDDDGVGGCDDSFECCQGTTESCRVGGCDGMRSCGASCGWGECQLGAAPANDACGGDVPTISASGSFELATCAAESDWGASCGDGAASPDVIFQLELSEPSEVEASVTDASFDAVMVLRGGDSCPGDELVCNDDGAGGTRPRIAERLEAGTYWLVLDGYADDAQGSGTVTVSIEPPPPDNDECEGATPLDLGPGRTVVSGSTAMATDDGRSCNVGNDLWYRFTLPQREVVFLHTYGSSFDTVLGLRDGSCAAATTPCADDDCGGEQSEILTELDAGTYYVLVDGYGSDDVGDFQLTLEHLPMGATGDAVAPSEGFDAGTTGWIGTTAGSGTVHGDCEDSAAPEHMWYWTQCPDSGGGAFSASTCDLDTFFDTVVHLWSGAEGANIACNDDTSCTAAPGASAINGTLPAGAGLFSFFVDGYGGDSGDYEVSITRPE